MLIDAENPADLQFFIEQFPGSLLLPTARMCMKVLKAREERRQREAEQKLAEAVSVTQEVSPRVSGGKVM